MATVSTLAKPVGGYTANSQPYLVAVDIDFAAAATAKGSALAADDIIEALSFEADTLILAAGIEAQTVDTGGSADVTIHLGITGVDVDYFVASFDWDAASAGDHATGAGNGPIVLSADHTIDLEVQTATTVPTAGTLRVWALAMPYDPVMAMRYADEVTRDQLA